MKRFSIRARTGEGKLVEDIVLATSKIEAREKYTSKGFYILRIDEKRDTTIKIKRVPLKIKVAFFNQLFYIVRGGVNVHRGLKMIQEQTKHVYFREILDSIIYSVEGGSSLSSALEKFPKVFDRGTVFLIRSAEEGGFLEEALGRVSSVLMKKSQLNSKVKSALIYPVIVLVSIFAVMYFMLTKLMPSMGSLLDEVGVEKPQITIILMSTSDFVSEYSFHILGSLGFLVLLVVYLLKYNDKVRFFVDKNIFKVPLFGSMVHKSLLIEFSLTLSSLLSGGVQLNKAMDNLIGSVKNVYIRVRLQEVYKKLVDDGASFTESLSAVEFFPKYFVQMVSVGEESGDISETLESMVEELTSDLDNLIKTTVELINPLLVIVLASVVALMVFALFIPMFSIMDGV